MRGNAMPRLLALLVAMAVSSTWPRGISAQPGGPADAASFMDRGGQIDRDICLAPELAPELGHPWHVDLLLGLPTGIRAQHALGGDDRRPWLSEAFFGFEAIF